MFVTYIFFTLSFTRVASQPPKSRAGVARYSLLCWCWRPSSGSLSSCRSFGVTPDHPWVVLWMLCRPARGKRKVRYNIGAKSVPAQPSSCIVVLCLSVYNLFREHCKLWNMCVFIRDNQCISTLLRIFQISSSSLRTRHKGPTTFLQKKIEPNFTKQNTHSPAICQRWNYKKTLQASTPPEADSNNPRSPSSPQPPSKEAWHFFDTSFL